MLAVLATGCRTKTISEILANPQHFHDDDVAIQGRVVSSFSIKGIGAAFQLDDGTGRIWVFTKNRPAPPEHIHIYVGGRVEPASPSATAPSASRSKKKAGGLATRPGRARSRIAQRRIFS